MRPHDDASLRELKAYLQIHRNIWNESAIRAVEEFLVLQATNARLRKAAEAVAKDPFDGSLTKLRALLAALPGGADGA